MDDSKTALIERYFRKELDEKELKIFQGLLKKEEAFAKAVALEKEIAQALQTKGKDRFRQRLDKIHEEEIIGNSKQATIKPLINKWWLLAASVLFLIGLFYFLLPPKNLSTEQLFAQNYELPVFGNNRTTQNIEPINQARIAYRNKDFQKTINYLTVYLSGNYEGYSAILLGASQLELGQFEAAITTFKKIKNKTDLKDDATWYLALTYLKKGDKILAQKQLQALLDGSISVTPKRKELAQQLLVQLE